MEKISVRISISLIMAFFLVAESGARHCSTCPTLTGTISCNTTEGNIALVNLKGELILVQSISSCCAAGSGLVNTAADLTISLRKPLCLLVATRLIGCINLPGLISVELSAGFNICGCLIGKQITCNAPQPSKCPDCKKCCSGGSYCESTYGKCV